MLYFNNDDIVQIGTPPGNAPVGALRLSGANAFALLAKVVSGLGEDSLRTPRRSCRDCTLHLPLREFGTPRRSSSRTPGAHGGRRLFACPARVFLMPAPASYTREDVAEIHLPGSAPLLRAAMDAFVEAGARPAAAGEFTFRAFRNGRLNLGQAEAVERVINAATAGEKRLGIARLGDRELGRIHEWRDRLLHIAALLEAALDFSEEEAEGDNLAARLAAMAGELAGGRDAQGFADSGSGGGPAGGEAPHIALVGLANAGKSSLLNALLGRDAALVSPQASTTRDSLRFPVRWDGADLLLSDNPGFDPATDAGGDGGTRAAVRALERLGGEDIACWVVDASRPLGELDARFAARLSGAVVVVLNKCDLPQRTDLRDVAALLEKTAEKNVVSVLAGAEASAAAGEGVAPLRSLLARLAGDAGTADAWSRREHGELRAALECCRAATAELSGPGRLELAADDVRRGVGAFSRALGEGYAEEALTRIFSQFCIGK